MSPARIPLASDMGRSAVARADTPPHSSCGPSRCPVRDLVTDGVGVPSLPSPMLLSSVWIQPVSFRPQRIVCCRIFERSELRKHSDVGLELLNNVVSGFPSTEAGKLRLSFGPKAPGFSRGVAYVIPRSSPRIVKALQVASASIYYMIFRMIDNL